MAIDIERQRPSLGNIFGGLSGPAIKPVALYMVYTVFKEVKVPIIGCGGIVTSNDAIEFILAGASAVQVGTANMSDPWNTSGIADGIERYLESKKIKRLSDLVGIAHN